MSRPTVCIVDLNILKANLKAVKEKTQKKVLALVKADAYGHGIIPCAKAFSAAGADFLGVATIEEANEIRDAQITTDVLCIGAVPFGDEEYSVLTDAHQTVTSENEVIRLEEACEKLNKQKSIHIKIDTGMHRLGVRCGKDLDILLDRIKKCQHLVLKGVFTHFSCSDTNDKTYTYAQLEQFKTAVEQIKTAGFNDVIVHCANSGAILSYPEIDFDMVRAGIILYGYYPSDDADKSIEIHPALSFETAVVALTKVFKGEVISYGGTFKAERDMLLAVLPVGYGDGYKRLISNKGYVLVREKKASVTGRVCMDMTMVDVTDIEGVSVGDKVVLIGTQGDEKITADDLALWCDTINYEIPLSITKRVIKHYVE